MKYDAQDCELVYKAQLTPTIYDFRLKNAALAAITQPGQFVQVLVPSKTLRRPISVCDVKGDTIRLVFEIRGEGTALLAQMKVGDTINIIAPLGHGFTLDPAKKTVFIGGGIGVPPMLYSAGQCGENAVVINGFRNKDAVILEEDFRRVVGQLIITTDDGSYGIHGFVTQPLAEMIQSADKICACGPMPMLRALLQSSLFMTLLLSPASAPPWVLQTSVASRQVFLLPPARNTVSSAWMRPATRWPGPQSSSAPTSPV